MPFIVTSLYRPAECAPLSGDAARAAALVVAETREEAEAGRLVALLEKVELEDFPPKMRAIADGVGREVALKLFRHAPRQIMGVPGREGLRLCIYVPVVATTRHRLAAALGMADFRRLVSAFGGRVLNLPNCGGVAAKLRNRMICDALVRGRAVEALARETGLTVRQVRNIAQDHLLPQSVRPLARLLGVRKALHLIAELPRIKAGVAGREGRRVLLYVPKVMPEDHRLVQILGMADARRLANAFGGELLAPANCHDYERLLRNRQIVRLAAGGVSGAELAVRFGLTQRSVRNIIRM